MRIIDQRAYLELCQLRKGLVVDVLQSVLLQVHLLEVDELLEEAVGYFRDAIASEVQVLKL